MTKQHSIFTHLIMGVHIKDYIILDMLQETLNLLRLETNTSGKVIEGSGKPVIAIEMDLNTGEIVIIEEPFNGRDIKSKEWHEY